MSTAAARPSATDRPPPDPRGANSPGDVGDPRFGPLIAVSNLRKTYRLGRVPVPVLRGATLAVQPGEFVAVLGASGSGKSTLLHLMGGLDAPDRGGAPAASIVFQGRDLCRASVAERDRYRRRSVGFVFQFYHLFPELTVLENVLIASMVGRRAARAGRERATMLLDRAGLSARLRHRPAELSGGERQRVAICRALVNDPPLVLADEPTGNLDRDAGRTVLDLLVEIRRDERRTMVVVTHDLETAARADRIVRLVNGVVVDEPPAGAGRA